MLLDAFCVCFSARHLVQGCRQNKTQRLSRQSHSSGIKKVTLNSISNGSGVGRSSVGVKNRRVLYPLEVGSVFTCGFCCLPGAMSDLCCGSNPQLCGLLHVQFLFLEKGDTVDHFLASFLTLCSYQCPPIHHPNLGVRLIPPMSLLILLLPPSPETLWTMKFLSPASVCGVSSLCGDFWVSSLSGGAFPSQALNGAAALDPTEGTDSICTGCGHSPSCQDIVPNMFPGCFFFLFLSENSHLKRLKWASWGLGGLLVLKTMVPVWREGKQPPSFHITSIHRRL